MDAGAEGRRRFEDTYRSLYHLQKTEGQDFDWFVKLDLDSVFYGENFRRCVSHWLHSRGICVCYNGNSCFWLVPAFKPCKPERKTAESCARKQTTRWCSCCAAQGFLERSGRRVRTSGPTQPSGR